jgi:alkylation response protein AidB-like acyl-CoA dehydrogenase
VAETATGDPAIDFAQTDEQQMLRDLASKWLADKAESDRVRELMQTDAGFDDAEWAELAGMGWLALPVPEELGGAGMGWSEVGVVAEEMGRRLLCAPWLSSAVLATAALLEVGGPDAEALLGSLAAGERRATLAHRTDAADVSLEDGALSGTARFVLDGATADVLLIPVAADGATALVAVDAAEVTATAMPVLDLTRKQAEVTFDGASTTLLSTDARAALDRAVTIAAVVLANEQVGGAQEVLEMSVEYGRSRKQFGRAIGSYQALKHRMAETLKEVEAAKSAAYHALRTLDTDDAEETLVSSAIAVSYCGEVYERAAGHNIQNHGGIGFTWEHDAHLYFKRAKTSKLLFGGGRAWRSRLADHLGF